MNPFQLFASPWWVNLLLILPFILYFSFRQKGISVSKSILVATAAFGIAFGFNESVVVIYLRAAVGLLPGYGGTFADMVSLSSGIYQQSQSLSHLPSILANIEFFREAATMIMLLTIAFVSAKTIRERIAIFLWTFAFWDLFYYVGLWFTVRWPSSILSPDVLFLIPVPWLSQVWFPLLVSILTIVAIIVVNRKSDLGTYKM